MFWLILLPRDTPNFQIFVFFSEEKYILEFLLKLLKHFILPFL